MLQGLLLGAAGLALRTGEQDEDRVEGRAGEAAVDAHERAAQAFTLAAGATFLAAAVAFALRNRRTPFLAAGGASVAISLAVLALGVQAGSRGGALVHGPPGMARDGEARSGGVEGRGGQQSSGEQEEGEQEEDEDD